MQCVRALVLPREIVFVMILTAGIQPISYNVLIIVLLEYVTSGANCKLNSVLTAPEKDAFNVLDRAYGLDKLYPRYVLVKKNCLCSAHFCHICSIILCRGKLFYRIAPSGP